MALTKITHDMNIVAKLDDEPNDIGGLSAAQLKAKFDEGGKAIQTYINDTLTPEIDAGFATKADVQGVILGQVPDGSITPQKLNSELQKGAPNGIAGLGADGKIPPEQVPKPDAYTKLETLSPGTCTAFDISTTSFPDDVFARLAVGIGKYGYFLTVKFNDGTPAAGITVSGLSKANGTACITDNGGNVLGVSTSASPTISITGYIDLQPYSTQLASTEIITQVPIALADAASVGTISTSQTVKFSRSALVDIHLIGAGYNGKTSDNNLGNKVCSGGDSGKAYYVTGRVVNKNATYSAVVGAQSGGETVWLGDSSASGTNATGGTLSYPNGGGGGVSPISSSLIVGGSGGCGVSPMLGLSTPGIGSNGGGNGASSAAAGGHGTKPGAGGGGGSDASCAPGNGAVGAIYYKWRLA